MFSPKVIRCHILDRRDQIEECDESLEYLRSQTEVLEQAVESAKMALQQNANAITANRKLKADIEATLHIHWLDNPPY